MHHILPHIAPRPWNHRSAVQCCATCDGHGVIASLRRPSTWDPFPERPCPDCDGPAMPECEVCGFTIEVAGYDCLACETVANLTDAEAAAFNIPSFADALSNAFSARAQASVGEAA